MEDIALSKTLKRAAGRPACLRARIVTSGRRWEARGPWRTIFTMWRLRLAYRAGRRPRARSRATTDERRQPRAPHAARLREGTDAGPREDAARGGDRRRRAPRSVYRELTALTLAHAVAARRAGVGRRDRALVRAVGRFAVFPRHRRGGRRLAARASPAATSAHAWRTRSPMRSTARPRGAARRHRLPAARRRSARRTRPPLLARHDAVLGPAEDGGYVLVGARRPLPFAAVRWSSPHALADTAAGFAPRRHPLGDASRIVGRGRTGRPDPL